MENVLNAAPTTASAADELRDLAHRPPPDRTRRSLRLLRYSLVAFGATVGLVVLPMHVDRTVAAVGFGVATALALAGVGVALADVIAQLAKVRATSWWLLLIALTGNGVMAFVGAVGTLLSTMDFRRGRQIRRFGRVLLPPVRLGSGWSHTEEPVAVEDSLRAELARKWRENGRTEHASVAAFSRLSLDLLALGAPPHLVAAAQRDALDEIRHAERCFTLARAIDGVAAGPGPFPAVARARPLTGSRSLVLARLAVDSLLDGALHEGVSARVIARLARRCDVVAIRAVLKELAADEGRHAAHGWEVVAWCVSEGGTPVLEALLGAVRALPTDMISALPAGAADGAWERYGIHGRSLEAAEYEKARRDVTRRVHALFEQRTAA